MFSNVSVTFHRCEVGLLLAMYHERPFRTHAYPLEAVCLSQDQCAHAHQRVVCHGLALAVQRHPNRSHYEGW